MADGQAGRCDRHMQSTWSPAVCCEQQAPRRRCLTPGHTGWNKGLCPETESAIKSWRVNPPPRVAHGHGKIRPARLESGLSSRVEISQTPKHADPRLSAEPNGRRWVSGKIIRS